MFLSVLLGTGAQILGMVSVTLFCAALGFLSPSTRGALMSFALTFFILFSAASGLVSGYAYKNMQVIK